MTYFNIYLAQNVSLINLLINLYNVNQYDMTRSLKQVTVRK